MVGTHQMTSIHKYLHRPVPKEELKNVNTLGGQIILASPVKASDELVTITSKANDQKNVAKTSSCENLTLYGAACVGKV